MGGYVMFAVGFVGAILIAVAIWWFMKWRASKAAGQQGAQPAGLFNITPTVIGEYMMVGPGNNLERRPLVWPP